MRTCSRSSYVRMLEVTNMYVNKANKRKPGGVRIVVHHHVGDKKIPYEYVTSMMVYDSTPQKVIEVITKALQAEAGDATSNQAKA